MDFRARRPLESPLSLARSGDRAMPQPGDKIPVQYYLVGFFDLLGQGAELRKIISLPKANSPEDPMVALLLQTLNAVERMRRFFKEYFESSRGDSEFLRSLPDDQRALVRSVTRTRLSHRVFSDSLIVEVPLIETADDRVTPINSVVSALVAACGIPLMLLCVGHPVRGGIDIGIGVKLETGEVYGSALARAVHLEETAAIYPRIAVGSELLRYLTASATLTTSTPTAEIIRRKAKHALDLIFRDSDGIHAVDFLGEGFRVAAGWYPERSTVEMALEFVNKEFSRYSAIGNSILAGRYAILREYFERRRSVWDRT